MLSRFANLQVPMCHYCTPPFSSTHKEGAYRNGYSFLYAIGCTVHCVAYHAQPQTHTTMGHVFTFARVG